MTDSRSEGSSRIHLRCGTTKATIDAWGATLTGLTTDGQSILVGTGKVEPELGHHGAVLAPWPNRIEGGKYEFDGTSYQLPINDERFGHALHGLAFDKLWRWQERSGSRVKLVHCLGGDPGYPFRVEVEITYFVRPGSLVCEARWLNKGDSRAPFGIGFHPYFRPGDSDPASWLVRLVAEDYLDMDPRTALPTAECRVSGSPYDFGTPRTVGGDRFSVAYRRRKGADSCTVLADPASLTLLIRQSAGLGWTQLFSGHLAHPGLSRQGIAVEPQTCPPNALVSGADILVLEPNSSGSAWWSVEVAQADPGCAGFPDPDAPAQQ